MINFSITPQHTASQSAPLDFSQLGYPMHLGWHMNTQGAPDSQQPLGHMASPSEAASPVPGGVPLGPLTSGLSAIANLGNPVMQLASSQNSIGASLPDILTSMLGTHMAGLGFHSMQNPYSLYNQYGGGFYG